MMAYLLAGALHSVCDLDVTNPSGKSVVAASAAKDIDESGRVIAAEHHCHACFPVSVPTPVQLAAKVEPEAAALPQPRTQNSGRAPGIDPPPPKTLT